MVYKKDRTNFSKIIDIKITNDSQEIKRPYLRPFLVKYGFLTIITAGGSGKKGELDPGADKKQRSQTYFLESLFET